MPFTIPTADEISKALEASVKGELPTSNPGIWPNNLYVTLKALAQAMRGAYLRLGWIYKQAFAITATGESLEAIGSDIGITRLAATYAEGSVIVTATNGTVIPANTRLVRSDDMIFLTAPYSDVTVGDVPAVIQVKSEDTGALYNTLPGMTFTLESDITGVSSIVVGDAGLTGGSEMENDEGLRQRILLRKRNPPHGGSPAEYIEWTREYSGVTHVFVLRATPTPGSVTIMFMMYDNYDDGIPLLGDIEAVQTLLESLAPSDANIIVTAPTPIPVDIELSLSPDTPEIRDAVSVELKAMFRRRAEPGSVLGDFLFSRSWISEAISAGTGEDSHNLVDPVEDVICGAGQLAVLGEITFI